MRGPNQIRGQWFLPGANVKSCFLTAAPQDPRRYRAGEPVLELSIQCEAFLGDEILIKLVDQLLVSLTLKADYPVGVF
jgi:hypothetical protein